MIVKKNTTILFSEIIILILHLKKRTKIVLIVLRDPINTNYKHSSAFHRHFQYRYTLILPIKVAPSSRALTPTTVEVTANGCVSLDNWLYYLRRFVLSLLLLYYYFVRCAAIPNSRRGRVYNVWHFDPPCVLVRALTRVRGYYTLFLCPYYYVRKFSK